MKAVLMRPSFLRSHKQVSQSYASVSLMGPLTPVVEHDRIKEIRTFDLPSPVSIIKHNKDQYWIIFNE
jgi:hypothetical protein